MKKKIFCGVLLPLYFHTSMAYAVEVEPDVLNLLPNTIDAQQNKALLDCDYRVSAEIDGMDDKQIINWAKYAVVQSFNFSLSSIDAQMSKLRACYTTNGWNAFLNALNESGNLKAIKEHSLFMTSQLDGQPELITASETQWKMVVPIKVIYKNEQETVAHFLSIYLTIGWRNGFNLGISQMIAIPRLAPASYKTVMVKEGIRNIYSGLLNKKSGSIEGVQNSVGPFFVSLFSKKREAVSASDLIVGVARVPPRIDSMNRQGQRDVDERSYPTERMQQKLMTDRVIYHQKQLAETATLNKVLSSNNSKKMGHDSSAFKVGSTKAEATQHQQISSVDSKQLESINCNYKAPDVSKIEQSIILSWAEHAVTQSFNFGSDSLEEQLQKLHGCYTEDGWSQFKNALEKSGNIQTFKTHKLTSLSQLDGAVQIVESRENQWALTLPLKVVYRFNSKSVTQLMQVRLVIGRKTTGEFGIMLLNSTLRPEAPVMK